MYDGFAIFSTVYFQVFLNRYVLKPPWICFSLMVLKPLHSILEWYVYIINNKSLNSLHFITAIIDMRKVQFFLNLLFSSAPAIFYTENNYVAFESVHKVTYIFERSENKLRQFPWKDNIKRNSTNVFKWFAALPYTFTLRMKTIYLTIVCFCWVQQKGNEIKFNRTLFTILRLVSSAIQ